MALDQREAFETSSSLSPLFGYYNEYPHHYGTSTHQALLPRALWQSHLPRADMYFVFLRACFYVILLVVYAVLLLSFRFRYTSAGGTPRLGKKLVPLGLLAAKTAVASLNAAYYVISDAIWYATGDPWLLVNLKICVNSLAQLNGVVFYPVTLLACLGWPTLPIGACARGGTMLLAIAMTLVSLAWAFFYLQWMALLVYTKELLVIVYAAWFGFATKRTQESLAGSGAAPNVIHRFAKFRCRILVAAFLYIVGCAFRGVYYRTGLSCLTQSCHDLATSLLRLEWTVADVLVLVALTALWWHSPAQQQHEEYIPVLPSNDDVELAEIENAERARFEDVPDPL